RHGARHPRLLRRRSIGAPNLADVRAVGNGAADGVDRRVADQQVEVGAVGAEGVVGGRADLRAALPPDVLASHGARPPAVVEAGTGADGPLRRLARYPVTVGDATRGGGIRM